jgi:galactose-1-phosphate uridylyltransferase
LETPAVDQRPHYDPACFLCPGNKRIGGHQNPSYSQTHLFPNDFPAVQSEQPAFESTGVFSWFSRADEAQTTRCSRQNQRVANAP